MRFSGRDTSLGHLNGLSYLAILLREPGRAYCPYSLREAAGEGPGPTTGMKSDTDLSPVGDLGELADSQTLAEINSALQYTRSQIEQAKSDRNLGHLESLQREEQDLLDYVRKVTRGNGRGRRTGDQTKLVRDQVRGAIKRSLKAIGKHLPDLQKHLEAALRPGGDLVYSPTEFIDWEF